MREKILTFPKQFEFSPKIENGRRLPRKKNFVVIGMGGSHLAADLLANVLENIQVHANYGLPRLKNPKDHLFIACSYSGNTEETIDGFQQALNKKLPLAVIATDGKLLALAAENNIPYIQLPPPTLPPRLAIGYHCRALLKLIGNDPVFHESGLLSQLLQPRRLEPQGKELAKAIENKPVIIYASPNNNGLALNWKIRFNETGKLPAFYNVFPELNHNEMIAPAKDFHYLLIKDSADHSKIKKRMQIFEKLYQEKNIKTAAIALTGKNRLEKLFNSVILADWTSYYVALQNKQDPESVPMIEEFKKMIKQ